MNSLICKSIKEPLLVIGISMGLSGIAQSDFYIKSFSDPFPKYAIQDTVSESNSASIHNEESLSYSEYYFDVNDSVKYGNNLLSSTYIRTEGLQLNFSNSYELINGLVARLLELISEDDDYSYNASEFITKQFEESETIGIEIIKTAVKKDDYRYSRDVITAVRASDIDYFQKWFKDLLIEGMARPSLKNYFQNIYDLYKDSFDAI
ncbi:TPA: hypothetical protein IAC10_00125 [Candidatus Scatousia excrementigallinarum]|uniref:Uncharacterized protein n=1 Tax=Candidatus Scatousia excrementigallinarum TaxID=2840935 RepID=A0A9D1EW17_9BACT|nr:hypothetical protein [Candidatus Scatousia excrementigallinarum]